MSVLLEFAAIWWQQGNISASESTYIRVRGHSVFPYHVENRGVGRRRVTEPTRGVKMLTMVAWYVPNLALHFSLVQTILCEHQVASGHLDCVLGKWNRVDNR